MKDLNKILADLKQQGCRITNFRRVILGLFLNNTKPLSYLDIKKILLNKKIKVNKTTVYRELLFLKKKNLVLELQLGGNLGFYEINLDHHHHLVCMDCKSIEDVKIKENLQQQEKYIEKSKKFKISRHSLDFYGLCQNCQ